jgi:hypothetical protein
MKILRKDTDLNILLNTETDFQTNLGWEENLKEFETEVLNDIINPIENYETVRYIHKPYTSSGVTQTDIWFYFYFQSGGTYVQDYTPQGISSQENENMLKQATESFFRLEFFKTPIKNWNSDSTYKITELVTYNGNTYTSLLNSNKNNNPLTSSGKWVLSSLNSQVYEPPTRQNRKLIFAKNLSLPLGEKMFYNPLNGYIHLPVFQGSNYKNKENMYFFWFQDESVLTETNLSGTTTGNSFFMTAKFYNAKDGTIIDFANDSYSTGHTITEQNDMYYQVDINKTDYSYQVYFYNGVVKCEEVGLTNKPIMFFERGGGTAPNNILYHICSNVTPTPTPTSTNIPTPTQTPTPTVTPTPTSTSTTPIVYNHYQYDVTRSGIPNANGGFFNYIDVNGATQTILQNSYGYVGRYCMRENSYQNNQYSLYTISQVGICGPNGDVTPDTGFTNANISYGTTLGCTTNYDNTDGTVQFTDITKGISSDVSAPYTVWMSGQTETGWTLVASGITEGGDTSVITNLKSDNKPTTDYYVYDIKIVDTNGKTRIMPIGVIFSCASEPPIGFTVTTGCTNYEGTGTLSVNVISGGTGNGYYWKIISGPTGYTTSNQTNGATITGLTDGDYAILIGDSSGDKISTNDDYPIDCPPAPNATETLSIVFNTSTLPSEGTFSSAASYSFTLSGPYVDMCSTTRFTNSNATSGLLQGSSHWVKNLSNGNVRKLIYNGNSNTYFDTQGSCTIN